MIWLASSKEDRSGFFRSIVTASRAENLNEPIRQTLPAACRLQAAVAAVLSPGEALQTAQTAERLPNVGSCLDFPVLPDDPFVRAELCQDGTRSTGGGRSNFRQRDAAHETFEDPPGYSDGPAVLANRGKRPIG